MLRPHVIWKTAVTVLLMAVLALPQRGSRGRLRGDPEFDFTAENAEVDQRKLTFVRVKFNMKELQFNQVWLPPWAHDIPRADQHLMKILKEFTAIAVNEVGIVLTLDDPELFKYPFAYMSEVGFWDPTEAELEGLRSYIKRGGFMIIDDFGDNFWWRDDWINWETQFKRAFPDKQLKRVDLSHPIFHSFFDMKSVEFMSYRGMIKYYAMEEENGRIGMIVNFNADIGEYWEWSDSNGYFAVDLTNEAFKLGINYLVYAIAH